MCDAKNAWGDGPLTCKRDDDHGDCGHVFHGDSPKDRHDKTEPDCEGLR